jgi:hypothetical protein
MRKKPEISKKVRITLDLSPQFYSRLEELERRTDADSKAHLLRQALQLYEYIITKTLEGYSFRAVSKDGSEETLVFLGTPQPEQSE